MLQRLLKYADKVHDLFAKARALCDTRPRPQIPTASVWFTGLAMFLMRCGSLHAVESLLRPSRRLAGLTGGFHPSEDTLGRVFARMPSEALRALLTGIVRRLGRNKNLESNWPLRAVAVDGHEFFRFTPPAL
jgi:hypothetical protein